MLRLSSVHVVTARVHAQTMREAWFLLVAAARQNHGPACCALGDIALEGFCASCACPADAVRWYAQASALGAPPFCVPSLFCATPSCHASRNI